MFRKPFFWILVVIVVIASAGGYYYYRQTASTAQAAADTPLQTATVRRGNLVISASGTGSVISLNLAKLGFETGGELALLNVAVGDQVKAGDVLAISQPGESDAALSSRLTSAQLSVLQAQQTLENLQSTSSTDLTLAQTQLNLTQKRMDLIDAQASLDELISTRQNMNGTRCDVETIAEYQVTYDRALDRWERSAHLVNSTEYQQLHTAEANLIWCSSVYSQAELDAADAQIASKQASIQLLQSQINQYTLEITDLQETSGIDSLDIAIAQVKLENAMAQLEVAQQESISNTIYAPFDGTILSISAQVGDAVGSSKFITMADLSQPYLEVLLDETDLNNIGIGYVVEVTFDALSNQTYTGHVISIDPSLAKVSNVSAVSSVVQLDVSSFSKPQNLPVGLSASVEIISSQAQDVLLVPVEALHELSAGKYAVFILQDGTPTLKMIEVGLMDYTYVEIKSGLNAGDVVTTGIVEISE